jgi:hypothetical protein
MSHQLQTCVIKERSASGAHDWLLFRGISNILRCDEAEVVHGIARYLVSQHHSLRILSALIERTRSSPIPGVIALIGWLRSFLSVGHVDRSDGAVWIARLGNERRALETLPHLCPELGWTELKFRSWPSAAALCALARKFGPRRILRIARRLHRRYEFFKVLRVVELIGYYARYLEIFQNTRFIIAVVSSHSNPHSIAFSLAARKCGVPTVLITHGMPVRPVARLSYDLAVVHCEAARQTYLAEGCRLDRVLIHGRRQHYRPMPAGSLPEHLTVGIFLCKDVNEERLRDLVDHLLGEPRVSRILVRPHPKNLWMGLDKWIASRQNLEVHLSRSGSAFRDIQNSDIVLAGNSSVLTDAVTAGRPSGYVPGLDHGSPDLHAFVARGLIYPIDELGFDPDGMLRFYQRQGWSTVLRLFANVDEDDVSVTRGAVAIMRELAACGRPLFGAGIGQMPLSL